MKPGIAEAVVGGRTVTLTLPQSFAVRDDIVTELAGGDNVMRAFTAALGVCWNGPGLTETFKAHKFNTLAYGGAVYDELRANGSTQEEIAIAAIRAGRFMMGMPIPADPAELPGDALAGGDGEDQMSFAGELTDLENFTEAHGEPST